MALTVTGFTSSALAYKIVHESNASDAVSADVLGGAGTLWAIDANQQTAAIAYLKIKITTGTVTLGTTQPDLMFEIPSSGAVMINLPAGLAFDQLSFWVTDAAAYDDTGDPGTVLLTFLCS